MQYISGDKSAITCSNLFQSSTQKRKDILFNTRNLQIKKIWKSSVTKETNVKWLSVTRTHSKQDEKGLEEDNATWVESHGKESRAGAGLRKCQYKLHLPIPQIKSSYQPHGTKNTYLQVLKFCW